MSSSLQKLDPSLVETFPSLRSYAQKCQEQAELAGKGAEAFALDQAVAANRFQGDGSFQILGNNFEKDFYCSAQIDWRSHEMMIDSGTLSTKERKPVGALWMSDACSLTRALVGDEELGGRECRDDLLDTRLPALAQRESVQFFIKECNQLLKNYGESFGRTWDNEVRPERLFLSNPSHGDGEFSLMFASSARQFVCEGRVSTLAHAMGIFAGNPKTPESFTAKQLELTDACTLTREALGENELIGECHDRTQRERNIEGGLKLAWHAFWAGLGVRDIYRLIRKGWRKTLVGRVLLAFRHPVDTAFRIAGKVSSGLGAVRTAASWVWNSRAGIALRGLSRTVPTYLGSATRLAAISRASAGALLLKGVDWVMGKFYDDYDKSVEERTTDRVYDKWVYSFQGVREMEHWYDVIAVPFMPIRAACRWIMPNKMNRTVAREDENAPIREQVLAEDRDACDKNLNYMRAVFVALKDEPAEVQAEFQRSLVEGLSQPAAASQAEGELKNLIGSIQEGAQFILKIKQNTDTIDWAREVFNADGTLKPGMEKKFLEKVVGAPPAEGRGIA